MTRESPRKRRKKNDPAVTPHGKLLDKILVEHGLLRGQLLAQLKQPGETKLSRTAEYNFRFSLDQEPTDATLEVLAQALTAISGQKFRAIDLNPQNVNPPIRETSGIGSYVTVRNIEELLAPPPTDMDPPIVRIFAGRISKKTKL